MDIKQILECFTNFIGDNELGEKEGQTTPDITLEEKEKIEESKVASINKTFTKFIEEKMNEVDQQTAEKVNDERQADVNTAAKDVEKAKQELEDAKEVLKVANEKAKKSNKLLKKWKKSKGLDKKDESFREELDKTQTYQFKIKKVAEDKLELISGESTYSIYILEDDDLQDIEYAIEDFVDGELAADEDDSENITGTEVVGFKYNMETGEGEFEANIFFEEDLGESLKEKITEEVVAKFDNGKHEIVKCKEGYFNRYNIKNGKARTTTKCLESLPSALMALKKRFPKAEEVKEKE